MKKLITTFLLLTAFLFSSVSPLFSQNYQELYQEALIKEEGEASLLEAIDIYNQIVEDKKIEENRGLLHGLGKDREKKLSDEILKLEDKKAEYKEYIDLLDNIEKTKDAVQKNIQSWNDLGSCQNEVINMLE